MSAVLPFYLLVDVSFSMTDPDPNDRELPIDALNRMVPSLLDAIELNPILGDKIRVSLIDFAEDARVQVPLCNLLESGASAVPTLEARGDTSFQAAFERLRGQIELDVGQLRRETPPYEVYRPAVFFFTDGEPTEPNGAWQQAFDRLVAGPHAPTVVPFGVGYANSTVLRRLAHPSDRSRAFLARDGVSVAAAIDTMTSAIIGSIIQSSSVPAAEGEAPFVLPDPDEELWDDDLV